MRIRTQLIMTMLLFGIVLAAIAASIMVTNHKANKVSVQEEIADRITQGASDLTYLANDYVIYRESQQLERWQTRFASFSSDVASLDVATPEQEILVHNIKANTERMKDVFESVAYARESSITYEADTIHPGLFQISWSRLAVQNQALVSDASRLSQLLDRQESRLRQTNTFIIIVLIGVLAAYFLVNYLITQRRALKGISDLQTGAAIIGSGNLDYKIEEKSNNEIGELSREFNQMTANLRSVTISKADLEREIARRTEVEEKLMVLNESLRDQSSRLKEEIEERKKAEGKLEQQRQILEEAVQERTRQLAHQIDKLGEAGRRIRSLSQRLIQVQEKERREIGHALHDEVGGTITVLKLMINQIRNRQNTDLVPILDELDQIVDELSDQIRLITHSLRPSMLDDYGLLEALQWYFERYEERSGIKIKFTYTGMEKRLPVEVETTAYRIMQEALTNAAKHSGAQFIETALTYDNNQITISIRDNGRGIDPQEIASGMGLLGMQDLAELARGSLTIDSSPGEGTLIICHLPVPEHASYESHDMVE